VPLLAGEYDVGLPPRNRVCRSLRTACRVGGAARSRALSLARRYRVVHADTAAFLGWPRRTAASRPPSPRRWRPRGSAHQPQARASWP